MDKFIYYARIFLFSIFAIFLLVAYQYNDWYKLMISLVSLFILIVIEVVPRKFSFRIPAIYVGVIYVLLFLGMVIGDLFTLYEVSVVYDKLLHFVTGFLLAIIGLSIIYTRHPDDYISANIVKFFFYAFFFMLLIESIWELIETFSDVLFGTNMTQGGIKDTIWDYIMDILGGIGALVLAFIHIKIRPINLLESFLTAFREGFFIEKKE